MHIQEQHQDNIFKGIAFAAAAFFMFTVMQALNKLLAGQHNVIEISFYRNLFCLLPFLTYIVIKKRRDLFVCDKPKAMVFRVVNGTVGLILTFSATQMLPITNATVLFFTSTLMIPFFARFFLNERVGLHRWGAVAVGMVGVLIVARPTPDMTIIGLSLALGAAVMHATIPILIRVLKSVPVLTITLYFFIGGTVLPGLLMPWMANPFTPQSALILSGVALTGGVGQYCLTKGFQLAPTSALSPVNYTGLIWAVLLDMMIWSYIPGWPVFAGGAIIIAANLYIIYREHRHARCKTSR